MAKVPIPLAPPCTREGFARLQAADFEYVAPDRHRDFRQGSGFEHGQSFRNGQALWRGNSDIFRVAAANEQSAHVIADRPSRNAAADGNYLACDFEAQHIGRAWRDRIFAAPLRQIRSVDPGGRDLDQHLAVGCAGNSAFDKVEDLRSAGDACNDGQHRIWQHRRLRRSGLIHGRTPSGYELGESYAWNGSAPSGRGTCAVLSTIARRAQS